MGTALPRITTAGRQNLQGRGRRGRRVEPARLRNATFSWGLRRRPGRGLRCGTSVAFHSFVPERNAPRAASPGPPSRLRPTSPRHVQPGRRLRPPASVLSGGAGAPARDKLVGAVASGWESDRKTRPLKWGNATRPPLRRGKTPPRRVRNKKERPGRTKPSPNQLRPSVSLRTIMPSPPRPCYP